MHFGRLNWVGVERARSADCKTKLAQRARVHSTPIVESFINTSSPSLTFPLTRFTQAMGTGKTRRGSRELLDRSRAADRYIVIRSPLQRGISWPAGAARLSRRNDLVRGPNSRSHTYLVKHDDSRTTAEHVTLCAHRRHKLCLSPSLSLLRSAVALQLHHVALRITGGPVDFT